jgi:hypothetical protein
MTQTQLFLDGTQGLLSYCALIFAFAAVLVYKLWLEDEEE